MNYCPKCGRQLADGEICQCTAQQPAPEQLYSAPQAENSSPQPPQPEYPEGYHFDPTAQEPKKKGLPPGCIIALVIGLVVAGLMALILAAILVPAMIGYTKKAKAASANSTAHNISNAANTMLVDLDTKDELETFPRSFILCSDADYNFNTEDNDTSEMYDIMRKYFEELDSFDYFIVVEDYNCVYVASADKKNGILGTYPPAAYPAVKQYSGGEADEDCVLNDLYVDAVTNLPIYDYQYDDEDGWNDDWNYNDDDGWYHDDEEGGWYYDDEYDDEYDAYDD